ncbi:T9SS type A sorting domain-containing protein [Mucilaginibacter arboris]|uniref:T9SS type A sorting domain-containing protein n=1 Tax=Mucilaginibacter arboris TaxID=2682090 RepID=A0A7K1SUH8_9SPHI|nr:T9SS type A sorting domain-containing protein [Mucilaginibacter arboris]MVN20944.1 T9SS type A sorting domain-containing protein [Mucilaginibacter arboris]
MKQIYSIFYTLLVLLSATLLMGFVLKKNVSVKAGFDSIPSRFQLKAERVSYLKNGLKAIIPAVKPVQNQVNTPKQNPVRIENEKLLTDVSIFPNPITDKLYLTYNVRKNTTVSIKIMDVLGNEVITLMSQRVEAGEQKNTFQLSNRLSSGFYFVRMIVGTESVIKRISVL